ncbi:integrator complex subunit 6-like [Phyllostomus hastatus]|uniref:integrator complex subunit 6-like n=1 Tax=Phyllostomus hastatus TaxID=9423 RepID=UPI001E684FB7|nr:integrator complex subunit 6-like [Phyllostomus hastatus]
MAGDHIPPNQLDFLSDGLTSLSKGELIYKPGSNALGGGIIVSYLSAGDSKAIAMSEVGMALNKTVQGPEKITADIKHQLMKEIRQFGRKYEKIFKLLEEVQGPLEVKKELVEFAIKEAARFKRRHLIQQLEEFLEKIHSDYFQDTPNM